MVKDGCAIDRFKGLKGIAIDSFSHELILDDAHLCRDDKWLVITIDEVDAKIKEVFVQIESSERVNLFLVHGATEAGDARVCHIDERDALKDQLGQDKDLDNNGEDSADYSWVGVATAVI